MPGVSIAIAGGGLIALATAWRLAQAGFRVCLFEKSTIGAEASWAGAGMLATGGEVESDTAFATLALESRELYPAFLRELEDLSHISVDYQECGALDLAYNSTEYDLLQTRAQRQRAFGIVSRTLTARQIATFWPRVRTESLVGALFYPTDAIVNPRELVNALGVACRRANVCIYENTAVQKIEDTGAGILLTANDRTQAFSAAVIAAGAWSGSIPVTGVPPLPLSEPVKGHLVGFLQPDLTCNTIIRHGHTYLLQRANGLLIAGASIEHVGWDRSVDPAVAASIRREAEFIFPHLAETTPSETWIGFRPGSDALHVGSWSSSPRLYLAYGHYRNGILLAPATARAIANDVSANLQKQ